MLFSLGCYCASLARLRQFARGALRQAALTGQSYTEATRRTSSAVESEKDSEKGEKKEIRE